MLRSIVPFAWINGQGGSLREGREMSNGISRYLQDPWNVLDVLSLIFLLIGAIIRLVDWTNPFGPGFYALSAPLLVSRALFFAQLFPFQGPMIQVRLCLHDWRETNRTSVQIGFQKVINVCLPSNETLESRRIRYAPWHDRSVERTGGRDLGMRIARQHYHLIVQLTRSKGMAKHRFCRDPVSECAPIVS